MRKDRIKFIGVGTLLLAVVLAGCIPNGNVVNRGADGNVSEETGDREYPYPAGGQENGKHTKPEENKNSQSQSQPQSTPTAEELEKEMAAYRAEREKGESKLGKYTLVEQPSEENYKYGIGGSDSYTGRFDARELNLAFKTADDYVKETLQLESEAWECIDPRMTAIYEDEDKGVADGYDADNIFLCEYNDHGTWKYLILVREKKGSDWNVLYHGSSYQTKKNGGDKK